MMILIFGSFIVHSLAQLCGTALHNMTPLRNTTGNYHLPMGTPCTASQCTDNQMNPGTLPWDIYFNFCQAVQGLSMVAPNCDGASVCQVWTVDSASMGQFSTVFWNDTVGGVIMTGLQGTQANGINRSFQLMILCPTNGISDPYPMFDHETDSTLRYFFTFKHVAACLAPTTTSTASTATFSCTSGTFFEPQPSPHCELCTLWTGFNSQCPLLASTVGVFVGIPLASLLIGLLVGLALGVNVRCKKRRDSYEQLNDETEEQQKRINA